MDLIIISYITVYKLMQKIGRLALRETREWSCQPYSMENAAFKMDNHKCKNWWLCEIHHLVCYSRSQKSTLVMGNFKLQNIVSDKYYYYYIIMQN